MKEVHNRIQKKRVVVTGIGVITSIGIGKEQFWQALIKGVSGIRRISMFDVSNLPVKIGGEVINFNPYEYISRKDIKRMDKFSQFGVCAAKMAIKDADIKLNKVNKNKIGVVIGTSLGGLGYAEKQYQSFRERGVEWINPITVSAVITSNCSSHISINLKINGPSVTISTACASATDAIGYARDCIAKGEVDIMIAGGVEAPLIPFSLAAFSVTGVMSKRNDEPQKACRPFDRNRDGQVLGEGGGILILENLESALRRGANIYAEIIGYGRTSDCYHPIMQDPSIKEASRAMRLALQDAKISPEEVEYINAHGSSTISNDKIETLLIKNVFGSYAYKVPISSIKSMIGHLQGGCGGPEIASTVLSVKNDIIPPTINYETKDPDCDLDYVPNKARYRPVNIPVKNSFGFGGKNAVLVFKKFKE